MPRGIAERIDPRIIRQEWVEGKDHYYTDEMRQNTNIDELSQIEQIKGSQGRGGRPKVLNEGNYYAIDMFKRIRKKSNREIAKHFGVSEATIRRALKEIADGSVNIYEATE